MFDLYVTILSTDRKGNAKKSKTFVLDKGLTKQQARTRLYKLTTEYRTKTKEGYNLMLKDNELQIARVNEMSNWEGWIFKIK